MIVGRGQTDNCHRTCEDGDTVSQTPAGLEPRASGPHGQAHYGTLNKLRFQLSFPPCSEVVLRKEGHLSLSVSLSV